MKLSWTKTENGGRSAKLPNGWELAVRKLAEHWYTEVFNGSLLLIDTHESLPTRKAAKRYGKRLAKLIARTPEFQEENAND